MFKKDKKKNRLLLLFVFYIFLIIIISLYHENWRDEAQAFLLCRDMDFLQFLRNIHYEGHPVLYYLFLFPFVKLGLGPKIVNILSILFVTSGVYLVLFHTNINIIQKIYIIVSYPILYEFSIIGRSYSLLFLLLALYGILYPNRKKHPIALGVILGLLINTHIFMIGFVMINIILFYLYELIVNRKNNKKELNKSIGRGLIIICVFLIMLLMQFYPMLYTTDGLSMNHSFSILNLLYLIILLMLRFDYSSNLLIAIISIVISLLLLIRTTTIDKKIILIYTISTVFIGILSEYIFGCTNNYHIALCNVILFTCFLMNDRKILKDKKITIYMFLLSILSILSINNIYYYEIKYPYSNSVDIAQYINSNINNNSVFICNSDSLCSSIIPYVKNKFYHTNSEKYFTYVVWNKKRILPTKYDSLKRLINKHINIYYIYTGYEKEDDKILSHLKKDYNLKKIYESKESSYSKEDYILFQIKRR